MESVFTNKIGLFGWNKLEPVLLAGLINELPILLIGKHGSAKSYLLEKLSKALKMNYKFYNASLIDYDDLVGIPIPTEDKKELTYLKTNTAIWDAEVVFIDEINRTKPDLQNKLFPIIYEKRVQGQNLESLKYRWAAMNPSYDNDNSYLGAMPLDDALADRFGFIINVPCWDDLKDNDKANILLDQYNKDDILDFDLLNLVNKGKKEYEYQKNVLDKKVNEIVINLMKLLNNKYGYFSARRATIIKDAIIATHAARITLNSYNMELESIKLEDTLYQTIPYILPNRANEQIDEENVYEIIKVLVESLDLDKITKEFMLISDPIKKLIYGFKNIEIISHEIVFESLPTLISSLDDELKLAVSYIINLKIKEYSDCPAAIVETFMNLSKDFYSISTLGYARFRQNLDFMDYEYLQEIKDKETDPLLYKYRYNFLTIASYDYALNKESLKQIDEKFTSLYKEVFYD